MSDSREESPDWLRCFQAPQRPVLTLSSDSDLSPSSSPVREDDIDREELPMQKKSQLSKKDQNQEPFHINSGEESPLPKATTSKSVTKGVKVKIQNHKEDSGEESPLPKATTSKSVKKRVKVVTQNQNEDSREEPPVPKAPKSKSPQKRVKVETQNQNEGDDVKGEAVTKGVSDKRAEPHLSSRMPLVMSEKVQRTKALVECEGESMDMSGDVGAVGRIIVSDTPSGEPEMLFDLKGTIYKTTIVPSRTFCVVSFGQTEAKVEAIMNDFIQLKPQSNVYEAETMIEGTLDGFSYDSEEETDKVPKQNARQHNQNDEADEETNGKLKGKAGKALGVTKKKGKTAAKPSKVKKKTQAPKKVKNAKK